jgi:NAD(P)-dependent dehydrogenase (short-subunit alcohol dehydrogenase family)/acyl dehydratase
MTQMPRLSLEGRVAIVTGAGNGLGRAHALELAARGACVVVNDVGGGLDGSSSDSGAAEAVASAIRARGGNAVADSHSVLEGAAVVNTALQEFGSLHIVVNNAGILRDSAFHKMSEADFAAVVDVHLRGSASVTLAAFPHLREQGYGRIIITTSSAGLLGNFGQGNYGAAKAGLYGLTRVLAVEGVSRGVLTNAIMPIAATRMSEAGMDAERRAALAPSFVSPVVAYLASEGCSVNGQTFNAGGGTVSKFFMGLTPGWGQKQLTAEDVAAHLPDILDEAGYVVPIDAREGAELLMGVLPLPVFGRRLGPVSAPVTTAAAEDAIVEKPAIDLSGLGSTFPPTTFEVTKAGIEAYAAATGDMNEKSALGIAAPAAYGFAVAFESVTSSIAQLIHTDARARIVHGAHDVYLRRAIVPGMVLSTTAQPWRFKVQGSAGRLYLRLVSTDPSGEVIIEQFSEFAIQGVTDLAGAGADVPPFRLDDSVTSASPIGTRVTKVALDQPLLYADASGDRSAIHLDGEIARAAGLPGVILQGMCTLAMSAAAATEMVGRGDPTAIARLAARFSAISLPDSDIETSVFNIPGESLPGRTQYGLVASSGGQLVLKHGVIEVYDA